MTNDEKILGLLTDCESFVKSRLAEIAQADASPETIFRVSGALKGIHAAAKDIRLNNTQKEFLELLGKEAGKKRDSDRREQEFLDLLKNELAKKERGGQEN